MPTGIWPVSSFNRTNVELKSMKFKSNFALNCSFNRTNVELKFDTTLTADDTLYGLLIVPMWN